MPYRALLHPPKPPVKRRHHAFRRTAAIAGLALLLFGFYHVFTARPVAGQTHKSSIATHQKTACTGNAGKRVIVSISKRQLWACESSHVAYTSDIITGDTEHADTLTPPGTYHIYAKQTDVYLDGADDKSSWHDYVHYWMPWLSNQYGIYGFHDATWRNPAEFGHVDPNSAQASHGCAELPLTTAQWLYKWAPLGTTVQVTA